RLAAVVVGLFVPLQNHLSYGQQDLMVLLACCLFLEAQLCCRESIAAIWLAGAIALKMMPSVLAVDLAASRKYRASAHGALDRGVGRAASGSRGRARSRSDALSRLVVWRVEAPSRFDGHRRLANALRIGATPRAHVAVHRDRSGLVLPGRSGGA